MTTYRQLLASVKAEIDEVSTLLLKEQLDAAEGPLLLDVREPDEWQEGHPPGALHIPRGYLEQRVEGLVPDRTTEIVVYRAGGSCSAFPGRRR